MTNQTINNSLEVILDEISDNCSIVERNEMKIIGIKTVFTNESRLGFLQIAEKYIKDGTVKIIENMVNNKNPGQYIGVMSNDRGGGWFDYIVGIGVDSFENLPEGLPENTVTCVCKGGKFAKLRNNNFDKFERYQLWEYFLKDFRERTEYVHNKECLPYHILNNNADVLYAYEPVKIPKTEDEKYDSICYEIVSLPDIKFIGVKRDASLGINVIVEYFTKYMEAVEKLPGRQYYSQDFIGFDYYEDGKCYNCFGAQVADYDNLPDGIDTLTLKGGLYVHITQLEINNDDPDPLYALIDKAFFEKNKTYIRDKSKCEIFRFHQGHSSSIYVPVRKR